uniref:Protein suppressor of PHYA-105 1-like isoform X1 n=1 Tax=Tanacetum cinerariifolium TaxID=118510 RepID=A0A6L2K9B8_TANCI|nr:protein suppressor of PHYA-105 1-like isoform X1 [Tanacetum cinerariifolium]
MCSSSYSPKSHEPSDDISVLLRQILSKLSSSSSSYSFVTKQQLQQPHFVGVANVEANVGAIDYDHTDEYDCEIQKYKNPVMHVNGPSEGYKPCKVYGFRFPRVPSTNNTLKLWDLKQTSLEGISTHACCMTYMGHTNEKVYAYHRSFQMPITSYKFGSTDTDETSDDNT